MKRLPRRINLGLYTVQCVLVTKKQMREIDDDWSTGDPTPEGIWDVDTDTIFIGRWLTAKRKREVLFHELTHAMIDYREHAGETHETHD